MTVGEQPLDAIIVDRLRPPGPGFWGSLGWTLLLVVILNGVGFVVAVGLLVAGLDERSMVRVLLPITSLTTFVVAVGLTLVLFGRKSAEVLALRLPTAWQVLLSLLLVAPLAIVMQEVAAWAGEVLPTFNAELYQEFAKSSWWLMLAAGCLLPGISEEIFFRGFLSRGLLARFGLWPGTAWCATLFAAIHLDPTQAVGILVIGVALQLVFLATRSLLVPILIHVLNNVLSFCLMKLDILADVDHLSGPLVASAVLALVPLAVQFHRTRTRWVAADGTNWDPGYIATQSPPCSWGMRAFSGRVSWAWLVLLAATYVLFLAVFAHTI